MALIDGLLTERPSIEIARASPSVVVSGMMVEVRVGGRIFSACDIAQALEKARRGIVAKRCSRCRQVKPSYCFGRHRCKPDGLNYACKACERAVDRKKLWRQRRRNEV